MYLVAVGLVTMSKERRFYLASEARCVPREVWLRCVGLDRLEKVLEQYARWRGSVSRRKFLYVNCKRALGMNHGPEWG
jgi:hypothetical protein